MVHLTIQNGDDLVTTAPKCLIDYEKKLKAFRTLYDIVFQYPHSEAAL